MDIVCEDTEGTGALRTREPVDHHAVADQRHHLIPLGAQPVVRPTERGTPYNADEVEIGPPSIAGVHPIRLLSPQRIGLFSNGSRTIHSGQTEFRSTASETSPSTGFSAR
jgi:hypothetical protein